jgi:hypothetical protein
MAYSILTNVPGVANTGRSTQGHIQYAQVMNAWWIFYITSTQSLSAMYSTNVTQNSATWQAPTSGSPFSLAAAHSSEGRYFGFAYADISSTDVLHMQDQGYHSRFTLSAANLNNTNAEALVTAGATAHSVGMAGTLDSTNLPVVMGPLSSQSAAAWRASNTDSGSSWTAGFGSVNNFFNGTTWSSSCALLPLASGNVLAVYDSATATSTMTALDYSLWNGSSWSANASVLTGLAAADTDAWGAIVRTTSDAHLVVLNNNAYTHERFNGSSWASGSTIPTLAYGTISGIALATDGTNVWAFVFDTSKVLWYCQWNGSSWGSWTTLESARSNTPGYLTAHYSSAAGGVMVAWTENTGSQFNLVGSFLNTSAVTQSLFRPATLSLGAGGPFFMTGVNG